MDFLPLTAEKYIDNKINRQPNKIYLGGKAESQQL